MNTTGGLRDHQRSSTESHLRGRVLVCSTKKTLGQNWSCKSPSSSQQLSAGLCMQVEPTHVPPIHTRRQPPVSGLEPKDGIMVGDRRGIIRIRHSPCAQQPNAHATKHRHGEVGNSPALETYPKRLNTRPRTPGPRPVTTTAERRPITGPGDKRLTGSLV